MKLLKIDSKLRKWKTKSENIFRFGDNCIWNCWYNLSLLRRKYLLLAVNELTDSPKILHLTQREFFNLNSLLGDQKIWEIFCRSYFNSVSAILPCHLSKGRLKQDFLGIYLTMCLGGRKFKNTSTLRVIFSLKMLKIESKFRKCKKKLIKNFSFLR